MKKVLVIVVTYNGRLWLDRCLGSVIPGTPTVIPSEAKESPLSPSLFVVDNDSTDGSADYVQAHFPSAKLIRSAENLGFSAANNLGMEYALKHGYDYVYLLNQDAWLEEGALEKLVAFAEANPSYAVLSPLQMTDGYTAFDSQFAKVLTPDAVFAVHSLRKCIAARETPQISGDFRGLSYGGIPARAESPYPVSRVMAAHWLVSVEAIRKVGLFNTELFPLYGQDDDWCNRARYHGFKIGVVPEARAVHDRAGRTETKERIMDRNYRIGSLVRLCDINRPLWERFLFVCLFTLVKAVKYGSFVPFRHFASICRQMSAVRSIRRSSRNP